MRYDAHGGILMDNKHGYFSPKRFPTVSQFVKLDDDTRKSVVGISQTMGVGTAAAVIGWFSFGHKPGR